MEPTRGPARVGHPVYFLSDAPSDSQRFAKRVASS